MLTRLKKFKYNIKKYKMKIIEYIYVLQQNYHYYNVLKIAIITVIPINEI